MYVSTVKPLDRIMPRVEKNSLLGDKLPDCLMRVWSSAHLGEQAGFIGSSRLKVDPSC